MDNSNRQMNRNTDNLGVNKTGKNIIKKSPVHQPNFANSVRPPQQPQPHVYNIDKNDFRNVVQQLTGSPSHHQEQSAPRLHQNNPPKPTSNRLQKIRPPPLMQINRPYVPVQVHAPTQQPPPPMVPYNNNHIRPPQQYVQPSPPIRPPLPPGNAWSNTADSPVSAYMRYLQNFIMDPTPRPITQVQSQPYGLGQNQPQQPVPGLLPNPSMPSPRFHGHAPVPSPRMNNPFPPFMQNGPPPLLPSPQMNGPLPPLPSPRFNGPPHLSPLPQMNNGPPLLPSPSSQFLLPSPYGFMNLVSPRSSSYPWFSPGFQHPPPLTPNFSFSPMAQSGILGPGPQAPPSPNYGYPLSPNGLFPIVSPRWRNH